MLFCQWLQLGESVPPGVGYHVSIQRLSGDSFDGHIWNGVVMCATGLQWVEAKDTAKQRRPTMAGQLPTIQNPLSRPPFTCANLRSPCSALSVQINGSGLC